MVTINGKTQEIKGMYLTYDQVIEIAFPNSPKGVNYSIVIESSPGNWRKSKILHPDERIQKFNGMKIKVSYTGNS